MSAPALVLTLKNDLTELARIAEEIGRTASPAAGRQNGS